MNTKAPMGSQDLSVEEYRRQLEQQVARKREASAAVEAPLPALAAAAAPPAARAAALGRQAREVGLAAGHQAPLDRLADEDEDPSVRLGALQVLKLLAIASPTSAAWRPQFLAALRVAVRDPELRAAALEVLSQQRDRPTQEWLLEGLREPEKALVPPDQALRLLGNDPHVDARDMAQKVADEPPNEAAHREALKVLASDPGSTGRFESLLADSTQSIAVRKLAATALNSLAPDVLRSEAAPLVRRRSASTPELAGASEPEAVTEERADSPADAELARHVATLLRARP
jgi:hypothetical protein